ncbi:MAG: hypothetical protein K0V04_18635 [Deltaproteobacteria bacterium]|nr:hypothetical protein [Deltaproteobacteria bacterium]
MRPRGLIGAAVLAGVAGVGCEAAPSRLGPGLDLQLRVSGAQLVEGGLADDQGGPVVSQVVRPQAEVRRGEASVALGGRLGPGGIALHVQAVGDADHWIVAPKGFDFVVTNELLWDASLELSHSICCDRLPVRLQAVDGQGRHGPVTETSFVVLPDVPPARQLISLGWDAAVDLDLHVELPDGTVVGPKNINGYEPPMVPDPTDETWMEGPYFEYDSNQQCRLDLRNRENVVWPVEPVAGRYRVYAQLFSACGQAAVNFTAMVQQGQEVTAEAGGTLFEFDARQHPADGEAPGLFVLEFEVP